MMARLEFSMTTKVKRFDFAKGHCEYCGIKLLVGDAEFHHEVEAERGGDNSFENCRALCKPCHAGETKKFVKAKAKAIRVKARHIGATKPKGRIKSAGFAKKERQPKIDFTTRRAMFR